MSAYRLTFTLPAALALLAETGRHQPCLHGCVLAVGRHADVAIEGPSRQRCFDQAARYLRALARGRSLPAQRIPAILVTPPTPLRPYAGAERTLAARGGRDTWWITLGAEISFAACVVEPALPRGDEPANILAAG
jgi:hypothetical protein